MFFKLALWAAVSIATSKFAIIFLDPQSIGLAIAIWLVPAIFLGIQDSYSDRSTGLGLFQMNIFRREATYRRVTFWGIPISEPECVKSRWSIMPDTTWEEVMGFVTRFGPTWMRIFNRA